MKWGVRRFQKKNGTLTNAGKKRYSEDTKEKSKHRQKLETAYKKQGYSKQKAAKLADDYIKFEKTLAAVAGLTVAACAVYAGNKYIKN